MLVCLFTLDLSSAANLNVSPGESEREIISEIYGNSCVGVLGWLVVGNDLNCAT